MWDFPKELAEQKHKSLCLSGNPNDLNSKYLRCYIHCLFPPPLSLRYDVFFSFSDSDKLKLFWPYFPDHFMHITLCPDLLELEIPPLLPTRHRGEKKRISDDWNSFLFTVAVVVCLIRAVEVIVGTPILFQR